MGKDNFADADRFVFRALDATGDGTGATTANGDYSLSAQDFKITAPSAYRYEVERLIVSVYDTAGMQAQEYGNLGAELTNGIEILVLNASDETILDVTDGRPIVRNSDWGARCYDVDVKSWGSGNEMLVARWTLAKAGAGLLLKQGQSLAVRLNDNFTGLIGHTFEVQGLIV